jgi:hypothetical protein
MPSFLFRFGFETPVQHVNNEANGWDDEDSHAVFIECDHETDALAWGREVAEAYVRGLWTARGEEGPSWLASGFAHWIETNADEIARASEWGVPAVQVGEHPVLDGSADREDVSAKGASSADPDSSTQGAPSGRPYSVSAAFTDPLKRPLLFGLVAILGALALVVTVPVGPLWRDALWSACLAVAAGSILWFERSLARLGRPSRLLRGVAIGLVMAATTFYVLASRRARETDELLEKNGAHGARTHEGPADLSGRPGLAFYRLWLGA